jgi:hypothetical protein
MATQAEIGTGLHFPPLIAPLRPSFDKMTSLHSNQSSVENICFVSLQSRP